jgi:formylmethanofuran dehydrogenase subunit B
MAEVVCAGCGTVCDDVVVDLSATPVRVEPHCAVAEAWFAARAHEDGAGASVGGEPVTVDVAVRRAATLLRDARRPLICGFDGATVEAVRAAVALADQLGAMVDTGGERAGGAVALRGISTATLGEIRDRAQVVVVWREDPETTHPRLLSRLGLPRAGRTLVVVDDRDTATATRADVCLRIAAERDVEAITRLHAFEKGFEPAADDLDDDLRDLLARLRAVPHAAFLHGGSDRRRALALHELVRKLNDDRHVVTLALRRAGGARGAEDALTWQTGYAGAVDLGSGHPELLADGLARREADVLLSVESDPGEVPDGTAVIALSSAPVPGAKVVVRTAGAGIGVGGTVHRMDGVPLTLETAMRSERPGAAEVLERLLAELRT